MNEVEDETPFLQASQREYHTSHGFSSTPTPDNLVALAAATT